jgi:hypothetical protein
MRGPDPSRCIRGDGIVWIGWWCGILLAVSAYLVIAKSVVTRLLIAELADADSVCSRRGLLHWKFTGSDQYIKDGNVKEKEDSHLLSQHPGYCTARLVL